MIQTYLDLCDDIDILAEQLQTLKRTRQRIIESQAPREMSGINYDGMPRGSMDATPLEVIASELMRLDAKIKAITGMLEGYSEVKTRFERKLQEKQGLAYQVVYRRDAKGMTLDQIADELGYTYGYICNISAQHPKIKIVEGENIG